MPPQNRIAISSTAYLHTAHGHGGGEEENLLVLVVEVERGVWGYRYTPGLLLQNRFFSGAATREENKIVFVTIYHFSKHPFN
jgi:hypothetical protein